MSNKKKRLGDVFLAKVLRFVKEETGLHGSSSEFAFLKMEEINAVNCTTSFVTRDLPKNQQSFCRRKPVIRTQV